VTTSLSIAAITAVLKSLLGNSLVSAASASGIGDVNVTAVPPDRLTTGSDERSQVNIFMYRVAPFSGIAKHTPLSSGASTSGARHGKAAQPLATAQPLSGQESKLSRTNSAQPLLLELSYLLTATGAEEFHSEILLGSAMRLLHDTPVLTPDTIRAALEPLSPKKSKGQASPVKSALSSSDIANQLQQIRITPQFLSFEDMSKLWSALQARYRPSMCYQVSAVMIGERDRAKGQSA
jgi:hypothetical protein